MIISLDMHDASWYPMPVTETPTEEMPMKTKTAVRHTPTPFDSLIEIYLDGLEASTDGRGWSIKHQNAADQIKRAVNSHQELIDLLKGYHQICESYGHNEKWDCCRVMHAIAVAEGQEAKP
jgi:hypothetical protein